MTRIELLSSLEADDIRRLNTGYTSPARLQPRKEESPQRTAITLEWVECDQPFVKHWETDDEELALLQEAVGKGFSWAAYDEERMVGIAIAEPRRWNRSLWVWELHVLPGHRGQGIGTRLLECVVGQARQTGLRIVALETQSTNLPAINFYRRNGFEIDGIDLSYYTNDDLDTGEVALFMKCKLRDE